MPERWEQVKEIVASALEHSQAERNEFVRSACGQDDGLRIEVESLLSHSGAADSLLENSPALDMLSLPVDTMMGRQIGAYRIVGEAGEGGMSVVYIAERADHEFRRRVAIKMLKPGCNQGEVLRRFRNERQTLAALDHPNIVRLLDGGATDAGLPYLVMEYVEGVAITKHCDDHRLSIHERLRLFQTACAAVEYAHRNGVIHRDLKPNNILVTSDGTPRLLDFGIAKLLNPECLQTQMATATWQPMTPEYASPEQMRGETVTSAADIYSLGALLYELLTGRRPYRATRASGLELERLVCEQDPEKPSVTFGRSVKDDSEEEGAEFAITPEPVAWARNTRPEELRRQLQGDLDTIVLMALRKEPQRRYVSAEEFANDIERHLSGRPVRARKPTLFYRGGKFLRRHSESVAAAAIVLAMMSGAGAWQARKIWKQNIAAQQADSVRYRARPSIAILGFRNLSGRPDTAWLSTALSEMLTTELAAGEQLRTVPGETVARTKIDLTLPDADSLASDTLGLVRKNLGSDFVLLGSYLDLGKDAGGAIRLDLRLQDTAKGQTVAMVSETGTEAHLLELVSRTGAYLRNNLGVEEVSPVESARIRASVPSNSEAMRLYSQGLARLRAFDAVAARDLLTRAAGADSTYAPAHSALAQAWLALGYDSNAQQEAKKALDNAEHLSREEHLLAEARYYDSSKQWDKALESYRALFAFFPDSVEFGLYLTNAETLSGAGKDALATIEKLRSLPGDAKNDPRLDMAQAEAAASLSDNKGAAELAEKAASNATAAGAKLLTARARSFQCRAFANLGQPAESRTACEEARRIYAETGDLAGVARALHSMAEIPLDQGDLEQAKNLYEQALSITRKVGDKRGEGRELGNLGVVFAQQGEFPTAERFYREAIANSHETGNKHGVAVDVGNMGELLHSEGRFAEALAAYKEALAIAREVGHKSTEGINLTDIGDVLADQGDLSGALQMYQQALEIHRGTGERGYYVASLVSFGRALRQRGDTTGAKKALEEAVSISQQVGDKGSAAESLLPLGELACDSGRYSEAETLARTAIAEFHREKESNFEILGYALLSRSLLQQGKLDEAGQVMATAHKLSEKSKDVTALMPLEIQRAYLRSATKDFAGAEQAARSALTEATGLGFVRFELEASMALGEIQIEEGDAGAGRVLLKQLEKTARAKGFELIAQRASDARIGEKKTRPR